MSKLTLVVDSLLEKIWKYSEEETSGKTAYGSRRRISLNETAVAVSPKTLSLRLCQTITNKSYNSLLITSKSFQEQ